MRDGSVAVETLRVGGVAPFSSVDFPGRLAAVVFTRGCPWRCGYCHNPHLLSTARRASERAWPEVLDMLEARRGLLEAVVFSGGEPTAQVALADAVRDVRALGFDAGLHTGGAYPHRLRALLPLVDWVGFDVKAPLAGYAAVTSVAGSGDAAFASLDALRASGVPFEVRTTVHAALTPAASLHAIARALEARRISRWVLQPFRATGCDDEALVAAVPNEATLDVGILDALRAYDIDIAIR